MRKGLWKKLKRGLFMTHNEILDRVGAGEVDILLGTQMPNASALYFQGTTQQAGGAGTAFGDGKRCAGGTTIRLETLLNVGGASQYPQPADCCPESPGSLQSRAAFCPVS